MKHKIKTFIISMVMVAGSAASLSSMPSSVSAANPNLDCGAQNGNATDVGDAGVGDCAEKTAFSFGKCGNTAVGIECLVDELLTFLTAAVGIAVVGGITAGGIVYATARGNPGNAQKGIKIISNSVIGLIMYFLMYAIINFLIPGGVFG